MAYIGREPQIGNFQVCDAISVVNGQAAYTMQVSSVNVVPETANHMIVSLNGVIQAPGSSFTVSGSTITFASNLATGDVINFIHILGSVLDLGVPSDSTVTDAKTNFVSTSSAAGLQIKGDGTTDGTLQLNCSQNSHGIKLKSPAHSASASYTLTFPVNDGDANQFLQTNGSGVLSFANAGGSLVKLASTTISSAVASVSFNSTYINSTYDNYRVIAYGLSPSADNQDIALRMSVDNGSNFATHVGNFNWSHLNAGSENQTGSSSARTSIPLGSDEEGDDSGGVNFIIDLMNLNSTTQYKFANGMGTAKNQSGGYYGYRCHGYIQSNTAVNFIKVFTEAGGNLDAGTVTLYGYEK